MDLHSYYEAAREPDRFDAIESNVIPFDYYFRKLRQSVRVVTERKARQRDWDNGPEAA